MKRTGYLAERIAGATIGIMVGIASSRGDIRGIVISLSLIILLIAARLVVKRHRWAVMAVIFCVGIFTGALRSGYIEHCGTLVDIMPQDKDSLYLIMRAKLLSPLEYRDFGMCHVPCRVEALTTLDGQPLKLTSKYRIELQIQRMSDLNWNTREMVHLHGTVITCQVRFRNKRIPKNPGAMDPAVFMLARSCRGVLSTKAYTIQIVSPGSSWHPANIAQKLRGKLRQSMKDQLSDLSYAMGSGIGLGDSAGVKKPNAGILQLLMCLSVAV